MSVEQLPLWLFPKTGTNPNFHSFLSGVVTSDLAFHSLRVGSSLQPRGGGTFLVVTAKPLFCNILHVSLGGSRFCADSRRLSHHKSFETNILGIRRKKNGTSAFALTPAFSIFCPQNIDLQGFTRRSPSTP